MPKLSRRDFFLRRVFPAGAGLISTAFAIDRLVMSIGDKLPDIRHAAYAQALSELLQEEPFIFRDSDSEERKLAKALIEVDNQGIPLGFYFFSGLPYDPETGHFTVHYQNTIPEDTTPSSAEPSAREVLHTNFIKGVEHFWGEHFVLQEVDRDADLILRFGHLSREEATMSAPFQLNYSFFDQHIRMERTFVINTNFTHHEVFIRYGAQMTQLVFAHEFGHLAGLGHLEEALAKFMDAPPPNAQFTSPAVMSTETDSRRQVGQSMREAMSNFTFPMDSLSEVELLAFNMVKEFTLRACERASQICRPGDWGRAR